MSGGAGLVADGLQHEEDDRAAEGQHEQRNDRHPREHLHAAELAHCANGTVVFVIVHEASLVASNFSHAYGEHRTIGAIAWLVSLQRH